MNIKQGPENKSNCWINKSWRTQHIYKSWSYFLRGTKKLNILQILISICFTSSMWLHISVGFIPSQDAQWCPFLKQENWKTLCGDRFKSRLITSWKKNRKDKSCLDNMLFSQIVQLTKRENHFLPQLLIILDIFIAIVLHNYNKCS